MPLLFAYGTLQQEDTQVSTFGRVLAGAKDEVPAFERVAIVLDDPKIIAATGRSDHVNAVHSGNPASRVQGTALEVTDAELASADGYERLASYARICVKLASGKDAWMYVSQSPPRTGRFVEYVGVSLDEAGAGSSRCTLQVMPHHINSGGIVHGGAIFTLADTGMAAALIPDLEEGTWCATSAINMSYFRPVIGGPIVCRSRLVHRGKSIVHIEGNVYVGDSLVARATGSWAVFTPRK